MSWTGTWEAREVRERDVASWWRVVAVTAALVLALVPGRHAAEAAPAEDGSRAGDPALSVDPATVHAAMACRGPLNGGGREPVLLVHGTAVTGAQSYGWNYLPELSARGYRACTVDLPGRSLGDIQVASEYVVVAVHRLARESGRKVDVLGHSQGALEARWAVRWWPSVQAEVDDLVSLAGPNQGTTVALGAFTPLTECPACTQMSPGSAFLTALNGGDPTPGSVSYTSLYSTLVDELVMPNATAARIDGASNIALQALCAARVVTHASIIVDAVAFALVVDALGRTGPAAPSRFDQATCLQTTFVGLPGAMGGLDALLQPVAVPTGGAVPTAEPPLKPYARPAAARAAAPITGAATTTTEAAAARPAAPASAGSTAPIGDTPLVAAPPDDPVTDPAGTFTAAPAASTQSKPAGDLSAQPATATRSTRGMAVALLAGLVLTLFTGAAGGVIVRRRQAGSRGPAR